MTRTNWKKLYEDSQNSLEAANTTIGELNTKIERIEPSNILLEAQVYDLTNSEGELRRDLAGTNEALGSAQGEIHRLELALEEAQRVAKQIEAQRAAANAPRQRAPVELVDVSYDDASKELVAGDFRAVVQNAIHRGENIVILGKDGKAAISVLGGKLPANALSNLRKHVVVAVPDGV